MRANHNGNRMNQLVYYAVSNGSKILKWEQITTLLSIFRKKRRCFQWFKDTKMRANHNERWVLLMKNLAVSNGSKILKWEQITTPKHSLEPSFCCFQWFKDTKMRANHNSVGLNGRIVIAVSNGSKILKWEQITTYVKNICVYLVLFPMVQRY